jgi:endo-1,4-beta-D-glucanase Y
MHVRNNCPDRNQFYVLNDENRSDGRKHNNICVSEGQGYGMLIEVLMAGYDKDAKEIFDGMYYFYKSHPSSVNPYLMSWNIITGCITKTSHDDNYSATDGDLDIALSLLMANKQWGSTSGINYLDEAKKIIQAIMQNEINQQKYTVLLSDALQTDDPQYFDTRSSDFMPGHFREFYYATGDSNWIKVIDNGYDIFKNLQFHHSRNSGLIPDFIQYCNNKYFPSKSKYMESEYDGNYYYNACRVPMRISLDYFLSGDVRAKEIVSKMNSWIRRKTHENPEKLYSGFMLNGTSVKNSDYYTAAFMGPFVVSAMIGNDNNIWLDKLYSFFLQIDSSDFRYYNNTLKMLTFLMVSGNFWSPSMVSNNK